MFAERESLFLQLFSVTSQKERALARLTQQAAGRKHIATGPVVRGGRERRVHKVARLSNRV